VIDLKLVQQAVTLARYRNYARAAEALHLSQPALSRSIAGLEAALGVRLFHRTRLGIEPTAFGTLLLGRGGALLSDAAELERELQLMQGLDLGELRVAAGPYPAELSVGTAAGRLSVRHPRLRIELRTDDWRSALELVLSARVDLAVCEVSAIEREPRLAVETLEPHPGTFFCRARHPLLAEDAPTIEAILAYPFVGTTLPTRIGQAFYRFAKTGTIDPDTDDYVPLIRVQSVRLIKDVVLASDAVGAAPFALIRDEMNAGSLASLNVKVPWLRTGYGFVYLKERTLSPAAQAFVAEVKAVEAEIDRSATPANPAARPRTGSKRRR
jgi:DNA-binding transcriptional LysR family regulator